jgi:hypothetical protein
MRRGAASRALRIALALLLGVFVARRATSGDFEIPRKLLEHEARVRAAFTPAEKSREAALEARVSSKMSVNDVTSLARGATQDEMFAVLMQYLKLVQKEAKENRRLADASVRLSNSAKASKLAQDNATLDKGMEEAKEKAQNLMAAATTGLVMGAVGGAVQAGAALPPQGSGVVVPTKTPTKAPTKGPPAGIKVRSS